jgi:hypothetical protein
MPLAIHGKEGCVLVDSALPLSEGDPSAFMTTTT